jgi:hypothetical protein
MTGTENIELGDVLVCISNEGLSTIGTRKVVFGITEKYINLGGFINGWSRRDDFRWYAYRHEKGNGVTPAIERFQEIQAGIESANKTHLANAAKRLSKTK